MASRLQMGHMIRGILCLLMILILLFTWVSWPLTAHAILAEGFAVGGAVAFTIGTLLDLLMVTFGASSMDGAIRNQATAKGQQPITYVGNLLNGYLSFLGENLNLPTVAQMFSRGTTYNSAGDIFLNEECSGFVADFQRWAWAEDGADLQSYGPVAESDIWTDGTHNVLRSTTSLYFPRSTSSFNYSPILVSYTSSSNYFLGVMNTSGNFAVDVPIFLYYKPGDGIYVACDTNSYSLVFVSGYSGTSSNVINSQGTFAIPGDLTFVKTTRYGTVNSQIPVSSEKIKNLDGFSPAAGDTIGDPETYPETGATQTRLSEGDIKAAIAAGHWQANIQDYLDSLANGYAGNVTSIPMTNEDTGEEETFPLTVPLDTPIAVDTVTDAEVGDQTDASEGVSSDFLGTEAYTLDLTQFFPFCVPFDLYHILEKFEASAEAPAFTWTFDFGAAGTYDLEIDFDDFSGVAAILRDIETVAFAVGLILLTKRLIQGGD